MNKYMISKITKGLTLALLIVLSAPVASAAPLSTNVNCAWGKSDTAQCIEKNLSIDYTLPNPIGVVAYAPVSCSYFIIRADEAFVIARDVDKTDSVRRGDAIYANPSERGNDFKRGKSALMVGSTEVRSLIFNGGLTVSEAVAAYTAKCGR